MLNMFPKLALGRHEHILQRVGKSHPPLAHTLNEDIEILFEQHNIGRLFGNIDRAIHGDADIGRMKRRGVIDPISHISDDMPGFLQSENDTFFVVGLHLSEDIHLIDPFEKRLITHLVKISTCEDVWIQ